MGKHLMPAVSMAAVSAVMPAAVIGAPRMDAAGAVEKLLGEVKQELDRVGNDVRKTAEQALDQAKKSGDVTAEVKQAADNLLNQFHSLSGAQQKLEGKLEALETRNLDLEQVVAQGLGGGAGAVQTAGQEIAESEALKAYIERGLQGTVVLRPANAITTAAGSGGGVIWPDQEREPVNMAQQRLPLRALLSQASTESDVVKYAKQTTRTNGAAMVAEGVAAPESSYGWTQTEVNIRKIAHATHISEEALADSGQLQALIDGELRYGLDLVEEGQLLAGDGVSPNLTGMVTEATAFSAPAGLPDDTRIDRLRLGLLQVALANYAANGITLHPTDWAAIELLKDTTGRYVFGNPNEQSTPRLWGLDVVPTLSHSAGSWMVGSFKMAATLYDRKETEVLISTEHDQNFIEGLVTMKATKRLALAIKRPAALVTGDFTFV